MEKNPLRISRLLSALAAATIVVGCAGQPQQPAEPEPEPVVEPVYAPEPAPAPAPAPIVLQPDHPERYVVVKGDTLWGISSRFLRDPWRWPEVWDTNPQIANPHLIYPGDVLMLYIRDGRPVIEVYRDGEQIISTTTPRGIPEVRLSPKVRVESLERAIPTIPLDAIRPFLTRHRVVSKGELDKAPYVVSSMDKHLIAAADNSIYVRGLTDPNIVDYVVVRPGNVYRKLGRSGEILGYEAIHVADVRLKQYGDVATLQIVKSSREMMNGDRLVPNNDGLPDVSFMPRAPQDKVKGHIIGVPDGLALIGQHQVVAISLGEREKMVPGHVLAIYQAGERVKDPVRGGSVQLPDEHSGTLMVFRTFEKMSYALVMKATRSMQVNDVVTNP